MHIFEVSTAVNIRNFTSYELNEKSYEDDAKSSAWTAEIAGRIVSVAIIMIATIVGNLTLIAAIFWKRSRRVKRVNIFLVNLAIGDLTVAMITMTTEILFIAFGEWILGEIVCKISVYLQIVTLASTTFLMTGMSIDRYQVIVKPLQSLRKRPKIRTKVILAWVMAFLFAIPQLLIFVQVKETKSDGDTQMKCVSRGYTEEWQRKVYFTFLTSYILVLPGAVMFYCYANIIRVVWSRAAHMPQVTHNNKTVQTTNRISINQSLVSASKRRVVTMTLTVIIGFLSCLTPYFIVNLIRIYSNYTIGMKKSLHVSEAIFMTHSALNPILYGIFSLRMEHFYRVINVCLCFIPVKTVIERDTSVDSLGHMNTLSMLQIRFMRLGNRNAVQSINQNKHSFQRKSFLRKNVGHTIKTTFQPKSETVQTSLVNTNLPTKNQQSINV
ncbi:neuropeptide S receptor-like [Argonauta hians]